MIKERMKLTAIHSRYSYSQREWKSEEYMIFCSSALTPIQSSAEHFIAFDAISMTAYLFYSSSRFWICSSHKYCLRLGVQ